MFFSLRTIWEFLMSTDPPEPPTSTVNCFDIRWMTVKTRKASAMPRDVDTLGMIVTHVTDVQGGFGSQSKRRKHWRRILEDYGLPGPLVPQIPSDWSVGKIAALLAVWERYRNTPYHMIATQSGHAITNHSFDRRSHHAGPHGNDGIGWAIDCHRNESLRTDMVDTGMVSLHRMITIALSVSRVRPIIVVPHRTMKATRRLDPNRAVWKYIVKPTVERFGAGECVIDYHFTKASGRPIPRSWDSAALYDDRGRKI